MSQVVSYIIIRDLENSAFIIIIIQSDTSTIGSDSVCKKSDGMLQMKLLSTNSQSR